MCELCAEGRPLISCRQRWPCSTILVCTTHEHMRSRPKSQRGERKNTIVNTLPHRMDYVSRSLHKYYSTNSILKFTAAVNICGRMMHHEIYCKKILYVNQPLKSDTLKPSLKA